MKKSLQEGAQQPSDAAPDPCYLAWFERFNACEYYEAHDVLEALWLRTSDGNRDFFKGLIQIAGAFVHLRKHAEHPRHAKHAARLRPAARLFLRAKQHLEPYAPRHLWLDVSALCTLCERLTRGIEQSGFEKNPWNPAKPPHLKLAA